MHRVFVDSDIILDVLAKRDKFYSHAAKLFTLLDKGEVSGFTSPIVFANIYYILRKEKSKEYALQSLRKLKSFISILPIDEKIIELALDSTFKDFEDSIQYHTAKSYEIIFIITRNKKHYKQSKISVCTAEEYLKIWAAQADGNGKTK
jgi:predicted nucleic acid-binding protein